MRAQHFVRWNQITRLADAHPDAYVLIGGCRPTALLFSFVALSTLSVSPLAHRVIKKTRAMQHEPCNAVHSIWLTVVSIDCSESDNSTADQLWLEFSHCQVTVTRSVWGAFSVLANDSVS